jgi:hypothetical protein
LSLGSPSARFLGYSHDRKRFVAVLSVVADDPQKDCYPDSQSECESKKVQKGREAQNENQHTAYSEEQSSESPAEGDLVHRDAGMTSFAHANTSSAPIIPPTRNWIQEAVGSHVVVV